MRIALVILVLAALGWWLWPEPDLRHPAGVTAPFTPLQEDISPKWLGTFKGYRLQAMAKYALHARVLHTKHYWVDGDKLVPYDVALGWGPMSDQKVLDKLKISQTNRFFFYEWQGGPPIPPRDMERSAANVHLISANRKIARAVSKLRPGQFVAMRGYLVNVAGKDNFHWNTSLRREDTGNGACEIFYVQELLIADEPLPAEYANVAAVTAAVSGE
jgi:hypothetical protein